MIAKVQKWGNSQGLRLSKSLLSTAAIEIGDEVDVVVQDGVRGGHNLRELVRRLPKGSRAKELDWGPPAGREVW